jgi:hypothetical protein|tara:strand:+ start:368 stop:1372 length:1005 start_codon:yes stop_codon:yes gene_type:complete
MAAELMVDVGDENEEGVEIDLAEIEDTGSVNEASRVNPNIADQVDKHDEEDDEAPAQTPQERFDAFSKQDPEAAEEYSKKVQKRIDTLTYKYHEEERQKQAALDFADGVKTENATLKTQNAHGQLGFYHTQQKHLLSELEQAKSLYKEAHSANDGELMAEANQNMSKFSAQLTNVETNIENAKRNPSMKAQETIVAQPTPTPTPTPRAPARAEPDEKAQGWADKNEWFGSDETMTQGALAIHRQMLTHEGYLPTSDAYYSELDARIRRNFPDNFTNETKPVVNMGGGQQVVTGGAGGTGGGKVRKRSTKVKLSASQVAIANKLGVPLEEYAKYV